MVRRHVWKFAVILVFLATSSGIMAIPAGATLHELQVGMTVPDLALKTVSGDARKLSELLGTKLTVVLFWSTWSPKSEKNLIRMQKLYQKYQDQGLAIVAVNADEQNMSPQTVDKVQATIERLKLSFPVLVDTGLTAFYDVGVIALPTTVIIDKERVISYELSGYPLVGSETMAEFIATAIEGKKTAIAVSTGYKPTKEAQRLFNMGQNTLRSRRMADTAESWYQKSVKADAAFVQPLISLGRFYLQKGNVTAAKEQFDRSLTIEPNNVTALCEKGILLADERKHAEALSLFEKSATIDEAYTPCYYYSGFVLGTTGKLSEALSKFDIAQQHNPLDYKIHLYKGRMYEEINMPREATTAYRKALELVLPPD